MRGSGVEYGGSVGAGMGWAGGLNGRRWSEPAAVTGATAGTACGTTASGGNDAGAGQAGAEATAGWSAGAQTWKGGNASAAVGRAAWVGVRLAVHRSTG